MPSNSLAYQRANAEKYWTNPKAKKKRAARNRARYKLEKEGRVSKGDWKQVDHKNWVSAWNGSANLRVLSAKKNWQLWAKKANKSKWKGYKKAKTIK